MKKAVIFLISFLFIITNGTSLYASAAYNKETTFDANIVLLTSLDDGTVIFNKNADLKTAPASLTKIVTSMVVLQHCKDLDKVIEAPTAVIRSFDGTGSSLAGILPGEELTIEQLLNCMLIQSANEAASILADYVGKGSTDDFVDMMNAYVKKLGCKNTHFKNPNGLDADGQYTTAYDLEKIVKAALKNKKFVEITSTLTYTIPATNKSAARKFNTTNFLVSPHSVYYYEYATGIKTGTTDDAGRCLISTAKKNGYSYLAIVLQAPSYDANSDGKEENFAFLDSEKAYEWAFDNIKLKVVADPSMIVTTVDIHLSSKVDHVRLVPQKEISTLVPEDVDSSGVSIEPIKKTIPDYVNAPIKKGDIIGKANILYAGEKIGTVNLVAAEDVSRSLVLYTGYLIKTLFASTVFKILAVILLLLLIFYVTVNVLYIRKKKRKRIYMVQNYKNKNSYRNMRK